MVGLRTCLRSRFLRGARSSSVNCAQRVQSFGLAHPLTARGPRMLASSDIRAAWGSRWHHRLQLVTPPACVRTNRSGTLRRSAAQHSCVSYGNDIMPCAHLRPAGLAAHRGTRELILVVQHWRTLSQRPSHHDVYGWVGGVLAMQSQHPEPCQVTTVTATAGTTGYHNMPMNTGQAAAHARASRSYIRSSCLASRAPIVPSVRCQLVHYVTSSCHRIAAVPRRILVPCTNGIRVARSGDSELCSGSESAVRAAL